MWNSGCIDWYYHNPQIELPSIINGLPDVGAIVLFHDIVSSTVNGVTSFVDAFHSTTGFVNPQGRKIISIEQCLLKMP